MSKKQVIQLQDLPDKILLRVFEELDQSDLLSSTLVCKRWNEIIGQSSSTMKKFIIAMRGNWNQVLQKSDGFTRKCHTIRINTNYNWSENMLKVMDRHATDSKRLFVGGLIKTEEFGRVSQMFASMTKLEFLKIEGVNIKGKSNADLKSIVPHNLKSLKSVVIILGHCGVLKFIETTQLTSLKIDFTHRFDFSDILINFLAGQNNLKELVIRKGGENKIVDLEKLKSINFPLKKLSLHKENFPLFGSEENLLLFLNKFVDTLEEFEIFRAFPSSVYEMIFKKFRHLKTLNVAIDGAPTEETFYQKLRPNYSVQKLTAFGYKDILLKPLQGFIGNLPNVKTLVIQNQELSKELMLYISNNLKQLNNLQIINISGRLFEGIHIPSLKSLAIGKHSFIKPKDWKTIVEALPNVEIFKVLSFVDEKVLNEKNINIITTGWPQLKHVVLGKGFEALKRVFDTFLRNCLHLKTVEISETSFKPNSKKKEIFRDFKRDGLRFIIHSKDDLFNFDEEFSFGLWEEHLVFNGDTNLDFEDNLYSFERLGLVKLEQMKEDENGTFLNFLPA